jgi:glycerol-3-phosphate O-acyltransferase
VRVPAEAGPELVALSRRGSVVFVMRSAGVLNFLFLAWLLRQLGLPPLRVALGLTGLIPRLARIRSTPTAVLEAVGRGEPVLVFLDRARGPDPFALLVAEQRRSKRTLLLVPALLVWTRRPQKLKRSFGDLLFGTPGNPSRFANAIGFMLNYGRAVLRLGAATDLAQFTGDRPLEPIVVLGRKVRGAIHLHLARQLHAVVGPPLKSADRVREQVLRDRGLRAALERHARDSGRALSEVQQEAERDLREIASRYSPAFIEVMRPIIGWILRRLYEAIDVDEEGLARLKQLAGEAPIVLCPSHKSHVDYLVLSWLFSEYGITPPHVAAGINLAFWPFGTIARHGGAFFIRRSLKGDRVYTSTLRAYVKQLLRDRIPQEFYVEGGRSRSGKLLFPKTGLVSMQVDAWLEHAASDVLFVPVAIDYEVLMEGSSYARELAGGEKTKEDWRGLLRARKVLRRRYGRLTLQFEEPISLRAFAEQRLGARAQSLTLDDAQESSGNETTQAGEASRRELVQALANRVAFGITRAVTVTTAGIVAAALLSHLRRGLPAAELARRVEVLRYVAALQHARFSRGLAGASSDPLLPGPVSDALGRLEHEGLVRVERAAGETIYQVPDERRPLLDYHKNAVLHRYVALSLIATAVRAHHRRATGSAGAAGSGAPRAEIAAQTLWLSRLLKLEFMYRVGARFDEIFAENLAFLVRVGAVEDVSGQLRPGHETAALDLFADMLRPYLESYRIAFGAVAALDRMDPAAGMDRRAIVKAALEHGRAAHAAGHVLMREAISKATFENAVEWLFQQAALTLGEGGRVRLAASWRERRLPDLTDQLGSMLTV